MSVDVLRPEVSTPGLARFGYPPLVNMKETRATQVEFTSHNNNNNIQRRDGDQKVGLPLNTFDPNYIIYNSNTDTTYLRGKLLGKGGFARCYELLDLTSNKVYAGKIIPKSRISKPHQKQKILREVELQKDLKHRNVVEFHSYFEDDDNVYIVLETCTRKSLVHVLKQRKSLQEPEVRYYMKQLIEGVRYVHGRNIIHRDLKLGNMLLNEKMELKVADFGLATRVDYDGEKKMTVCGTPNYIAPEVLQKKGHSFEADIWALGCVMYALLVGHPPFETPTLKETYVRITENAYILPVQLSPSAKNLIQKCLTHEPEIRPSPDELLADEFFTAGYMPKTLSPACCTSCPKFPVYTKFSRPKSYAVPDCRQESQTERIASPLSKLEIHTQTERAKHERPIEMIDRASAELTHSSSSSSGRDAGVEAMRLDRSDSPAQKEMSPRSRSAATLLDVLNTCLEHMPKGIDRNPEPMNDSGITWVTKWVDYSNKYGFGFQLSNDAIGVSFNDTSRILMSPEGRSAHYYDMTGNMSAYSMDSIPDEVEKKTTLLLYFARYMDEHLIQGGNLEASRDSADEHWPSSLFLKKWFRTQKAIVLYLSDGTLQVNFFDDHTKIILSHLRNDYLVTYIGADRVAKTYSMMHLIQDGCQREITDRMVFAKSMLKNLVDIEGADI